MTARPPPSPLGLDNPHRLSKLKTELTSEGKYDEYGNRRPVRLLASQLPLQRIESIDEPPTGFWPRPTRWACPSATATSATCSNVGA